MSKLLALVLLVTGLALPFFFGRDTSHSPGKVTLRYLTYETGKEQQELVNSLVAEFERRNPDIHVEAEMNAKGRNKIYIELASGTAPDVFYAVTDDIPRMAARGALLKLDPLVRRDGVDLAQYFPKTVAGLQYHGGLYAMPVHFSTDVLFYNKKLFDEAGVRYPDGSWTWDDYLAAARRLTRVGPDGRKVFGTYLPDPMTTILANGGSIFSDGGRRCVIDNPRAREALQMRLDMMYRDKVAPAPVDLQDTSNMQLFESGRLAMMPGRTYMVIDFNKSIEGFEYDVAPMPGIRRKVTRLAVGGICVAASSRHQEAAWKLARFYSDARGGQRYLCTQKNCVPAITRLAWSPKGFLQGPPHNVSVFVSSLKDAEILAPPVVNCTEYMERIQKPAFDEILHGRLTIPQALGQVQRDGTRVLSEE
ncbi:MAG TPA: sugar ABC transporter substrate-binding protein [Armatimonadota bacterium]|jgi:multiple sugar transport system substrate-binding protein